MQGVPLTWLESRCLPYYENTSLYPIVRLAEAVLGFQPQDSPLARRGKLIEALDSSGLGQPASVWLLSLLLGLPTDAPAPQRITEDQRERMRETLVTYLQRQAAREPLALLIEDLHWADPTTIAWLGRSLDALAAAHVRRTLAAAAAHAEPRAAPAGARRGRDDGRGNRRPCWPG
jgi:predicted ATPase